MDHLNSSMEDNKDRPHVVEYYSQKKENRKNKRKKLCLEEEQETCNFVEADYKYSNCPSKTNTVVENVEEYTVPITPNAYSANGKNFGALSKDSTMNMQVSTMNRSYPIVEDIGDDCEAFGRCVAAQLRQMPKLQKYLAQKVISETCFRGQLHLLNFDTSLVKPSMAFPQVLNSAQRSEPSTESSQFRNDNMMMPHQQDTRHQIQIPVNVNSGTTGSNHILACPLYSNMLPGTVPVHYTKISENIQ